MLDVDSVNAFVLIADQRSFTRAARMLGTSQGALSVKIRRLEDKLGVKLLDRTPRNVDLSAQGRSFLEPARQFLASHQRALEHLMATPRRFRLGISASIVGPGLSTLLTELNRSDPPLLLEVRIDASPALIQDYDKGHLDAVVSQRPEGRDDGDLIAREPVGWFAAKGMRFDPEAPLPLASLAKVCGLREIGTRALDGAGIPWKEAFVGGGSLAVTAAVSAGLAIAPLIVRLAPSGAANVGTSLALPELPAMDIVYHGPTARTAGAAPIIIKALFGNLN